MRTKAVHVETPPTAQRILDYLKQRATETTIPPSRAEIGAAVGIKSTNTVQYQLNILEEMGLVHVERGIARGITLIETPA
jgi:repressor LexA